MGSDDVFLRPSGSALLLTAGTLTRQGLNKEVFLTKIKGIVPQEYLISFSNFFKTLF
jgi:hypothetical protein